MSVQQVPTGMSTDLVYGSPPRVSHAPQSLMTPERRKMLGLPLPGTPSRVFIKHKPDWLVDLYRSLRKISEANRERPIDPSEMQIVRQVASDVVGRKDPKEILLFLKVLADFVVYDTKEVFFEVLAALRSLDGRLNCLFRETDVRDPSEGPSFSPFAINEIFHSFEEDLHYRPGVMSAQPLSRLPELVEHFISNSQPDDCPFRCWAIWNDVKTDDPHIVPVFITKRQGKNSLYIFDSLGHCLFSKDHSLKRMSFALHDLIVHFDGRQTRPAQPLVINSCKLQRQFSKVGCATSTILDLKHLYERHIGNIHHIDDFYRSQEGDFEPYTTKLGSKFVPVVELYNLPSEMMKSTQSEKLLEHFRENPPSPSPDGSPVVERYTSSGEVKREVQDLSRFDQTVSMKKRVGPNQHSRNYYVEQKRLSEVVSLLTRFYDQSSAPDPVGGAPRITETDKDCTSPKMQDIGQRILFKHDQ